MTACLAAPLSVLAQDNVVATATLPRDLSVRGMFLNADPVVKAVMIGLVFASAVTWTVWLAKSIEIFLAKRRLRLASNKLAGVRSTIEGVEQLADIQGEVGQFLDAAATELKASSGFPDIEGIKERVASRLDRIEAGYARRILRGTGVLATIGATAPFGGLFGTAWGIMDSLIGISKSHTTTLAVVAPGIPEARLATAPGPAGPSPAGGAQPLYLTVKAGLTRALGDDPVSREGLGGTLDAAAKGDKDTRIFLRADKAVPYGEVMEVMNLLRAAGYLKVALVGLEKAQ